MDEGAAQNILGTEHRTQETRFRPLYLLLERSYGDADRLLSVPAVLHRVCMHIHTSVRFYIYPCLFSQSVCAAARIESAESLAASNCQLLLLGLRRALAEVNWKCPAI